LVTAPSQFVTVVASEAAERPVRWVMLVHRVPREPSSPRIAVWRRLRALGVAQLGDGLVALPEDARTREQLEWVAEQVVEAGGTAVLLRSETLSRRDERGLVQSLVAARAAEYDSLAARVTQQLDDHASTDIERRRLLKSVRRELRAIQRRDHFPPAERDAVKALVDQLAARWTQSTDAVSR
jgi:hypothetical protein